MSILPYVNAVQVSLLNRILTGRFLYVAFVALGTALLLIGDQLTKWLVIQNIEHYQSISIIKLGEQEILNFTYRNTVLHSVF